MNRSHQEHWISRRWPEPSSPGGIEGLVPTSRWLRHLCQPVGAVPCSRPFMGYIVDRVTLNSWQQHRNSRPWEASLTRLFSLKRHSTALVHFRVLDGMSSPHLGLILKKKITSKKHKDGGNIVVNRPWKRTLDPGLQILWSRWLCEYASTKNEDRPSLLEGCHTRTGRRERATARPESICWIHVTEQSTALSKTVACDSR